jgi:choline kinase
MKVVILAAGEGKRLRPFTVDRPKCLVEIDHKALLDYQLDVIRSAGIEDVVVVKGHLGNLLKRPETRFYLNERYEETNMVWTLFCARQELQGNVVVSYGDIAYALGILKALIESPGDICVVVDRAWETYWKERFSNPLDDAETLKMDSRGRIVEIGQRPESQEDIQGQYIGLMKFSEEGLAILKHVFDAALSSGDLGGKPPEKAYMTDMLQAIIDRGYDVWPVFAEGGWVEIDTVQDLSAPITRHRLRLIKDGAALE